MALTRIDSYLVDLDSLGGITFDDNAGTPTFKVDATTHRVGFGTSAPVTQVHISDGNGAVDSSLYTSDYLTISAQGTAPGFNIISASSSSGGHRGVFKATRARGTLAEPAVPENNDDTFSLLGAIWDGSSSAIATASITFEVDGNVSEGVAPQRISFLTGTTNSRVVRMTIKGNGNVGVNTSNPSQIFHVRAPDNYIKVSKDTDAEYTGIKFTTAAGDKTFLGLAGTNGHFAAGAIQHDTVLRGERNLIFATGGATDRVKITDTGNVGIGTNNPTQKLHVDGAGLRVSEGTDDMLYVSNSGGFRVNQITDAWTNLTYSASPILAWDYKAGVGNMMYMGSGGNQAIADQLAIVVAGSGFKFGKSGFDGTDFDVDSSNEFFRITNGGNVGINTVSPQGELHVYRPASEAAQIIIEGGSPELWSKNLDQTSIFRQITNSNGWNVQPGSGAVNSATWNAVALTVDELGNVGVGSAAPLSKLDVYAGTMTITGGGFATNVTYGGRSIQTHIDVRASSMRGGMLVRNMNDYRQETDSASFMHYDAYNTTALTSYAFRAARGATLADTFWVKGSGDTYVATSVGIGTETTRDALDLETGDVTLSNNRYIGFNIYNDGAWKQRADVNAAVLKHHSSHGLQIYTGGSSGTGAGGAANIGARFTVSDSGNIGIGTNTPQEKVHIETGAVRFGTAVVGSFRTGSISRDTASGTFTPPTTGGLVAMTCWSDPGVFNYPQPIGAGLLYLDTGASPFAQILSTAPSSSLTLSASAYTGNPLDYADNVVTVIVATGSIRIVNRSDPNTVLEFQLTFL